jgi:hypothetical protein
VFGQDLAEHINTDRTAVSPCLAHLVISEQRSFASASQLAMRRRSAGSVMVFAINELGRSR